MTLVYIIGYTPYEDTRGEIETTDNIDVIK